MKLKPEIVEAYRNTFAPWCDDPDWADDWDDGEDWDHEDIEKMAALLREHLGSSTVNDALRRWDEHKHPRGQPENKGQFGPGGGGSSSSKKASHTKAARAAKPMPTAAQVLAGIKPKAAKPAEAKAPEPVVAKPATAKAKKMAAREDFAKAGIRLHIAGGTEVPDSVLDTWNEKVGMDPAEFKRSFTGGLPGGMTIIADPAQAKYVVNGSVRDERGRLQATFTRNLNIDGKSAYSALFEVEDEAQGSGIGKAILAGNIATYEKLGIEEVKVSAGLTVGGYAWAKYGYVPTQGSWDALRASLKTNLGRGRGGTASGGNRGEDTIEADSWDMLSQDQQDEVRERWNQESESEFIESEISNWRDSGYALQEAKQAVTDALNVGADVPEWATTALNDLRDERKENDRPEIPFTDEQLREAMTLEFESRYEDGKGDFTVTWDDGVLNQMEPKGYSAKQPTLPGIEEIAASDYLTAEMREQIEDAITKAAEGQAESDADDMEPPDMRDQVAEYQNEYWDGLEDEDRLRYAVRYDMHNITIERDEEEELELELEKPKDPENGDPVLAALDDRNPRAIWALADTARGKELLLRQGWSGVLNLKDKETMERFRAYVSRPSKKRAA